MIPRDELDNATPTVLSKEQLPSRKLQKLAAAQLGPEHRYDHVLSLEHSGVPWGAPADVTSVWPSSDDGSLDGDEPSEGQPIDEQEIYDLIATISDPEHPLTLGELAVVNLPDIHIQPPPSGPPDPNILAQVLVDVTPTINHCSMSTIIGLAIRVRLERALPPNYRVDVRIKEGTHNADEATSKQLADKERVAAALENQTLRETLDMMLKTCK